MTYSIIVQHAPGSFFDRNPVVWQRDCGCTTEPCSGARQYEPEYVRIITREERPRNISRNQISKCAISLRSDLAKPPRMRVSRAYHACSRVQG